jgi:hypothetical protein
MTTEFIAHEDLACESCGRRGRDLVGIDMRDGSSPFRLCHSCANDALASGWRAQLVGVEEAGE